jgi:hypothetical protein
MLKYLLVCLLVFLAGFVDSIAGGGGLISLPAYIIAGIPTHLAIGTNKMSSTIGTTVSTGRYIKNGYLSGQNHLSLILLAMISSLTGSAIGSRISLLMDDRILKHMMIVVLPVVAFYVLKNKKMEGDEEREPLAPVRLYLTVVASALVIGVYDGFYGPGTGTFLLLVLTGLAHMSVRQASAMTKILNLTSNVAALTTFLIHGTVVYPLGIIAGLFCLAGHYLGSGLVVQNGQKIVRPVVIIVLIILFIKIVAGI